MQSVYARKASDSVLVGLFKEKREGRDGSIEKEKSLKFVVRIWAKNTGSLGDATLLKKIVSRLNRIE
jgi:hypothetical protein